MKPILKYRGGKSKEIPKYIDYIPEFDMYFEPFFGGGATYFYLEPQKAFISDINKSLMSFYETIASDKYYKIKNELFELQEKYDINRRIFLERKLNKPNERVTDPNDELYYEIRNMFNGKQEASYEKATLYFFINKTAYSGMIRYNSSGEFNVPYGRYANFNTDLLTEKHHRLLATAEMHNTTYELAFERASSTDFLYLDPPYDTVFSDYGNEVFTGDFGEIEHKKLAEDFKNLSAPALMIIGETKLTKELYSKYVKDRYPKNYSVNIRNRFKSEANHLIITNF
ncbi:DNA adenine methylase [Enterococcus faecalis]|uniref:DNA adenine methylase n=1 Tax=Enterococcus faecalis TaxID=1351 RepID=UPI00115C5D63|nr:Dam family site-specific DNA-(adenine-N6)-methyltransferase [Enterococcus faecalis]EKK5891655.1 Dam family site-specific DNA-(adenine-N6)-methyltransferase [Enterococcus faecalis]EKO5665704.1 Dam family site-specific DNA-(adenine-N6)-methyltransferase [Enterococcus faecalis]MDT2054652.1 Dam family site-specific DNA-(adenine-N6)-methyltransferase [Enterococcus faecalis]MDT2141826.1 Dam family site-specific DNA-(adenine-N6)-methyltransferase [Enterococcus faecalis]MDV7826925.1 Dam family site